MRRTLLEFIWPSRNDPAANHERRAAVLRVCIAMAIALAAGPEIFAAMEMTALLDLLGAVLFLTAMSAGAKLMALSIWSAICKIALPAPQLAVLRSDASTPTKALALVYVAAHVIWCPALVFIFASWSRWVIQLTA
jgi:hypothetical protein